ncbi:107-domain-containing protein [Boeremia exigua]|uniref:107-domain-containing protein n=1 Tax=Boeremia exigua TaxID=749465 RepID=UPI001E8D7908|nr:107-domain-containing protein [Boeremia exigua]KAH6613974.1 107-domain-containing protein [Boeremia exigua]
MAPFSFARQAQSAQISGAVPSLFGNTRATNGTSSSDPIQPLRAMADRVGKEVEKFAERVDHWHTQGKDSAAAKHQATMNMVGHFRDVAESQVKELKGTSGAENQGALNKSTRRRVQHMGEGSFGQSFQSVIPSAEPSTPLDSTSVQELRQWQAELATWDLLRTIIDHYHPEPGRDIESGNRAQLDKVGGSKRYSPNSEIWDRFLLEDEQAKEKDLILRWLEQTAQDSESDIDSITAVLEEKSGKGANTWTSGWLDTKSKIKQAKRMEGSDRPLKPESSILKTADRSQPLVTQLDPDAPSRQKRALEKSDEFYEKALWLVCYEMMRRGVPWKEICEWAMDRSEAWRGVSIGAAHESHTPGTPNVAGDTVGYMFRRMCFYAAQGTRLQYEGAVYGLLSGDLDKARDVARSWDDHLYAHYNALLLSRFDSYLQRQYPSRVTQSLSQRFVFHDAVANLGEWTNSPRLVINALKQHKASTALATTPIKLVQGAVIAQSLEELVHNVGVALAEMLQHEDRPGNLMIHPNSPENDRGPKAVSGQPTAIADQHYQTLASDPHAFRTLVHVFIALRGGLDLLSAEDRSQRLAMDNVIAGYIEFLRLSKRIQLIPLYAAQLETTRQAYTLARVLPDIKNRDEQRNCIALLDLYRVDTVEVVAQSFLLAFNHSGFIHFDEEGNSVITRPIKRFSLLESTEGMDPNKKLLWPGQRIKPVFDGSKVETKDEGIIDAVYWYNYLSTEVDATFEHLKNALIIFLLNGRLAAAEKMIEEVNVEYLSLSRTEALCGYPFDFNAPGAEEQDERALHAHRETLSREARSKLPVSQLPDPEHHEQIVLYLRARSAPYYDLQQIVRLLAMFREWRAKEQEVIECVRLPSTLRSPELTICSQRAQPKVNTKPIKELLENITAVFDSLIPSLADSHTADTPDILDLKRAYIPEIVITYLSILQTSSFLLHRETAIKAMEMANLVASPDNEWLQELFLRTGRMSELVQTFAKVSQAMLNLNEYDGKKKETKKRGSKGETLRIWDLNANSRV